MKALRFVSALLIVAAFADSCIKDEMIENAPAESHTVTISANFSDFTKTLISEDSEGHYKALWEAGDVICVTEIVTGTSSDPNLNDIDSQSDFVETAPLAVGGETATFTVTFPKYWWEEEYTAEQLATYTFNYQYFACTKIPNDYNSYYIATDYENGKKYIPLIISNEQKVYEGGYNTDCDMLVSQIANYNSRPDNISFNFARLGTIVKMTLKGLQQGDVLKSGYFYTGDNYMAACSIEEMVIYYPETGTYKNRVQPDYYLSDGLPKEYCQINFTSSDESRPIVFDENGEAVLYLRILPGVCDGCFGVKCTVERGGVEMEYSKFANLETLGRSLTFKEGGLTKFSVELKPAVVASPTKLNYFVPKPRTGFTAYWQADPNAIGYECQYVRTMHYDYDTGIETTYPKVKLTPVKGSGDKEGMYYVEVPDGMEADSYVLGVRPIPNSDSGLCDFDLSKRTLYVGVPVTTAFSNSSCEKITESIWKLTEMDDTSSSPWYLDLTNMEILGNEGSHWFNVKDINESWVISTCTEPERQHIGEIRELIFRTSSQTTEITSEVYGLKTDGTSTKMSNFTRDGYLITYDFIGEGSFNGFRIKDSNVNKGYPNWSYIYIDCYPPEKMY